MDWVSSIVAAHKKKPRQSLRRTSKKSDCASIQKTAAQHWKDLITPCAALRKWQHRCQGQQSSLFWMQKTLSGEISLDKKSSMLMTFSTPFEHYRFLQMPFSTNSTNEVFQCCMEHRFTGYPCSVMVDYIIIIGGCGIAEHDANLKSAQMYKRGKPQVKSRQVQISPGQRRLCKPCLHKQRPKSWPL